MRVRLRLRGECHIVENEDFLIGAHGRSYWRKAFFNG